MRTLTLICLSATYSPTAALLAQGVSTTTANHIRYGTSTPATCNPLTGDVFFKTSATITQYYCSATNTWTALSAAGAGAPPTGAAGGSLSGTYPNPGLAKVDVVDAIAFCLDAGSTDAYACNLSPAITAYVTGTHYRFKAATANTGAATIAFNSLASPKTIVKVASGITTALADNDIRVGQWVDIVYDGTNMQMQSLLGNAPTHAFTCNIGSATSTTVISTGDTGCYSDGGSLTGTINRVDILGNAASLATCSITVDIWKRNAAIPTASQKISASAPATLSSATVSQSGSLSGWTTSVAANDIWGATVASVTGCVYAQVSVEFQ